tara:strand:- start:14237 stop:14581 length:345 start_codon:yes stop_codon:yes gene_type:complete
LFGATIAILIVTLSPAKNLSTINIWDYDKLGHFLMFGVWTFLYGLSQAVRQKRKPNLWMVFILGSAYGLLIELLQFVLPTNRSPETLDFIADMIGSALAILPLNILLNRIFSSK